LSIILRESTVKRSWNMTTILDRGDWPSPNQSYASDIFIKPVGDDFRCVARLSAYGAGEKYYNIQKRVWANNDDFNSPDPRDMNYWKYHQTAISWYGNNPQAP